jgi:hypothetical protein
MPELRKQSNFDDRYMVLIGEHVVICDLTRDQAQAIMRALERIPAHDLQA